MALSTMKVFSDFLYGAATEELAQQVELFNAASGNTLILRSKSNVGDYSNDISYGLIASLMRRRNAYGSGAVGAVGIGQLDQIGVKVAGGTAPILFEPQQFSWIQRNPQEAGVVIGAQVAKGILADQVNTALKAGVAACSQTATHKVAALTAPNLASAVNTLFGDRAQAIKAWFVHSLGFDAFQQSVMSSTSFALAYSYGTVNVFTDVSGRRLIVTDSPSLYVAASPTSTVRALGLVENGIIVEDNGDYDSIVQELTGNENLQRQFQAEYTFNLKLKGYQWDTTNGGKSPTDAAIATQTNWDQIATSVKDTAGVLVSNV